MEDSEYPALYKASDTASIKAQSLHLLTIKGYAIISISGAGISVIGIESKIAAFFAAVIFLVGLFLTIFIAWRKHEGIWYRSRAVAESIKTAAWRFMMAIEPFGKELDENNAKQAFKELLKKILNEHEDLAHDLAGKILNSEQISDRMVEIRRKTIPEKKKIYQTERIDDQLNWYANKAKLNKSRATLWFWILIIIQGVAVILTLLRIAYPECKFWPTELFVAAGANVLIWIQVKRFRELSASYALAANEISIAICALDDRKLEEEFSDFIRDTENIFSREHTQWIAKKA